MPVTEHIAGGVDDDGLQLCSRCGLILSERGLASWESFRPVYVYVERPDPAPGIRLTDEAIARLGTIWTTWPLPPDVETVPCEGTRQGGA